jgi:hypothetical protein
MQHIIRLATVAALAITYRSYAVGDLAQVSIVDQDSGAVLDAHPYRGEYWVAGNPGGRYAIQIRNRLGERLMAVTSVDGVNVVSGATAGWDQTGYVFNPGQEYQITGWRKTDSEVAAFIITDSHHSYAERTGRPANVGVIGVAVFRERVPQTSYAPPPVVFEVLPPGADANAAAARSSSRSQVMPGAVPPAPAAAPAPVPSPAPAQSAAESAARRDSAQLAKLGTGHGEREYSHVTYTHFVRLQPRPDEVIRIHYDSLDNLLAMGILTRPAPRTPSANPFPASPDRQYVPDPPG